MSKEFNAAIIMAQLLIMDAHPVPRYMDKDPVEPKNKYNLTSDQIEKLKLMSPKEKKTYLKGLK